MKHLKFLFLFISLAIFASCSESDVEGGVIGDANQATFSGTIGELQTRVTNNAWDAGDAIGVYALKADQALSEAGIFDGKSNVKYTTTGNGTFTAAGTPINFPETGNLDFVSYYPYKTVVTGYKYDIDVTSQSDLAAIDLLYSNNAKGKNKSAPNVALNFNHMLSKLELNIQLGQNLTSLAGLTVGFNDVVVDGSLALADGTVTTGTTRKNITPNVTIASDNKTATVAAIVVPGQNLKDVTIVFSLGGKDYKWTPTTQVLNSTYKYAYTVKLNIDDSGQPVVVPVEIGATINDWKDPQIGDTPIVLDPETEAVDPFINVAPTSLNFAKEAGSQTIAVTANVAWTASSDADWLTIDPASGTNNGTITVTATENGVDARNATITITDGTITKTVPVTQKDDDEDNDFATDLFFSEYIEGSSNNKYLEIYNGTGADVVLDDYEVVLYSNGNTERGNNVQLSGTLAQGAVIVIANSQADIYAGDVITSTVTYFNGDDAIALQRISTGEYVDIIGRIGEQVKWDAGGDLKTEDRTLVRKPSVRGGVTVNPTKEGFPTLATEWIGHPQDYHELGSHTTDY